MTDDQITETIRYLVRAVRAHPDSEEYLIPTPETPTRFICVQIRNGEVSVAMEL